MLATGGLVILLLDERTSIESVSASAAGRTLRLHGSGAGEVGLRRLDGRPIARVVFRGEPLPMKAKGDLEVARFDFGGSSVGVMAIDGL